jgi:glutathione peroxidase
MPPPSPSHAHNDEGEKGDKLRRRARARRLQNAFVCMGILCITFVATVTQFKHNKRLPSKDYGDKTTGLRFRPPPHGVNAQHKTRNVVEVEDKQDDVFDPDAHARLPEKSIYRLSVDNILGEKESLSRFAGMVTLVVNTACKWGKTKLEYHQLAALHAELQDEGFSVLAFPSNDFHQELETNQEIANFWKAKYPEATFPVFAEGSVYQRFKEHLPHERVHHNFFKYLVNRDGIAVKLFTKKQDPFSLKSEILELLHENQE